MNRDSDSAEYRHAGRLEPASVAPMPDQQFETIVLMLLEAGVVDEDDLPHLDWDTLPCIPEEEMSDQDRAQLLAFEAYDICFEDPDEARELADEAIEIDELCIDARAARWFTFDIRTEEALTAAGAAAVMGHEMVRKSREWLEYDDVWMYPRLRGAARGYAELALTNWVHGDRKEAIEAARETLDLAPGDPLRMAPRLVNWYLALGSPDTRTQRARRLFRDFGRPEIAPVAFAEALMTFIDDGPGLTAKSKLLKAARAHPLVMFHLSADGVGLAELDLPGGRFPSHAYRTGGWEELMVWYPTITEAWGAIDGARQWAGECLAEPRFDKAVTRATEKLLAEVEELGLLPEDWDPDDGDAPVPPNLRLL
jgi:tetratricopeptide (TPR) repeat protein